ncbi:NAD(P)-binding protein [Psychrobacter sp. F1192]|uniref:NAD(P)-binding protein n=1 Tax=Psychrobacter coccoides TaxID=2818440 RepID=A0ABS3NQW3_9GAMM|nr:NAD(P)-binding protein [Psychrobacter coccoides]MBO1531420.1 NAD(P)-binding protein [Psychrobacter coccoides]
MTDLSSHEQPSHEQQLCRVAIIGGGLTGLFTATLLERVLQASPWSAQINIFEKSSGVGRLATRYRTDNQTSQQWQWAFGAQFFTAKTSSFQQFIAPWLESKLIQPWCAPVIDLKPISASKQSPDIQQKEQWDTGQARYISTPKMTSWGRALADELKHTVISFKTRVAPLTQSTQNQTNKHTELFDEQGDSLGHFDWVICTAPNAQAVALMADSGFTKQAKISEPQMQACYTLMLGWDNAHSLPETLNSQQQPAWDVAHVQDSIIDRLFIEHHKPNHDGLLPSITIHARNDWSEQHVDEDIEAVKAQLLQAAQQALDWNEDSTPSQIDCHRWRYAATVTETDKEALGILVDQKQQWIVSGDWCGQGNIESCYQMAKETAAVIKRSIGIKE